MFKKLAIISIFLLSAIPASASWVQNMGQPTSEPFYIDFTYTCPSQIDWFASIWPNQGNLWTLWAGDAAACDGVQHSVHTLFSNAPGGDLWLGDHNNGTTFSNIGFSYPVVPSPTPDPNAAAFSPDGSVMGAAESIGTSLVSGWFSVIPVGIAIVGGLIVTLFAIRKLIGWVRKNIHG